MTARAYAIRELERRATTRAAAARRDAARLACDLADARLELAAIISERQPVSRHIPGQPTIRRSGAALYAAALAGREPAESLHPDDRADLIAGLAANGWTVHAIADHTRTTLYTVDRILTRTATHLAAATVTEGAA